MLKLSRAIRITPFSRLNRCATHRRLISANAASNADPVDFEKLSAELRARRLPLVYDYLNTTNSDLLSATLFSSLPEVRKDLQIGPPKQRLLWPGHHLAYFRPSIGTLNLLPDGTDLLHAPGEPWTQRVWAGGRVQFTHRPGVPTNNQCCVLNETIRDVKVNGRQGSEKIFVNIRRVMVSKGHSRAFNRKKPSESNPPSLKNALIIEDRELCFFRKEHGAGGSLKSLMKPRSALVPPTEPDFSHSLTPNPALLFRFSALTFNAHAIHIDPEYTRQVYGLPNLVVHGPLTLVLMLECMRRCLAQHEMTTGRKPYRIVDIEYKNLMPLFVNEKMTICCKRSRSRTQTNEPPSADVGESWSVWIQKAQGDLQTMAVRGTVRTEPFQEKPTSSRSEDEAKKGRSNPDQVSTRNDIPDAMEL